jgi:putative transposase
VLVYQAYKFELDPNNATRARFYSHTGAARFVFNFGLEFVNERRAERNRIRRAGYKELLSDEVVEGLARRVAVPRSMYSLRREWYKQRNVVAPWWAENSKFAYESGLTSLGEALSNYSKSKSGERAGKAMEFPSFRGRAAKRSCRFWATEGLGIVDERRVGFLASESFGRRR